MKRFHLFELEDQQWFPENIRNYGTDFLGFVAEQFDLWKPVLPIIEKGIQKSGGNKIIDLASGGGGGWNKLSENLSEKNPMLKIVLTDYFPNIPAFKKLQNKKPNIFEFETESVDALHVPENLKGLRTQFLSFHHFKPEQASQILQNAVDSKAPIAIFEAQERDVIHLIKFFFSPLNVLLTTPFIRPFTFLRLLFTYLIPIVPIFVWWDGLVSVLRTYTVEEMQDMAAKLNGSSDYVWEIGKEKNKMFTVLYLLGYPKG